MNQEQKEKFIIIIWRTALVLWGIATLLTLLFIKRLSLEQVINICDWLLFSILVGMIAYIVWYIRAGIKNDRRNKAWRKTIKPGDEVAFYQGGDVPDKDCTIESINEDETATVKMKVNIDRLYKKKEKK